MTIKIKTFTRTNDVPDEELNKWLEYIQVTDPMFKLIDIKYNSTYIMNDRCEFMNTSALVIFSTSFENDVIECGYDVDCECT
jgi:hypothetical protein